MFTNEFQLSVMSGSVFRRRVVTLAVYSLRVHFLFCGVWNTDLGIFKEWVRRQNEAQLALRKHPNSETLLRMQEMMKVRPPKKKRTAACRIEESPEQSSPELDPLVPAEFQQKYHFTESSKNEF
jgi:hypothetical protein